MDISTSNVDTLVQSALQLDGWEVSHLSGMENDKRKVLIASDGVNRIFITFDSNGWVDMAGHYIAAVVEDEAWDVSVNSPYWANIVHLYLETNDYSFPYSNWTIKEALENLGMM